MNGRNDASPPVAQLLAWIVLALLVAAGAYTVWIAMANFNRIGV